MGEINYYPPVTISSDSFTQGLADVFDDLEHVVISGGTVQDFVIGSPVDSVVGYAITASGGNLDILGLLAPVSGDTTAILIWNENLNGQNREIKFYHDSTAAILPSSKILNPDSGGSFSIKEYASIWLIWDSTSQRWYLNEVKVV